MPDYQLATERAARKYKVDPAILKALVKQESDLNPKARSGAGAVGIAQFMPGTAKGYGVNLNDNRVTDDLEGAARYIADNLKRTGGDYRQALSIYNSGRPDAYKDPNFANGQTYNYVKTIMAAAGREKGSAGGGGTSSSSGSAGRSSTTTRTVGGVDNSAARRAAILSFIQDDKADPVNFALQVRSLQDVPGQKVTTTTSRPSPASGSTASSSSQGMSPLKELFWQGRGGIDVKNGVKQPQGFVSGHTDHVHVAAGPKTVVELGKLAQQLGLHVGENPQFGGVNPVHVKGSYHYKNEAIDVSGDPKTMAHYAALVAHKYGLKVKG